MFDLLVEGLTNYRAEVATLPLGVYIWMWTMRTVLILGGLVFIGTRAGRVVFSVMVLNILGLWYGKGIWPDLPLGLLGTGLHLVLWVPMGIYLISYVRQTPRAPVTSFYHRLSYPWAWVALGIIGISLIFDVRELSGLLLG